MVHPYYNGFHNAHMIIGIKDAAPEEKAAGHNRFRAGLHHLALKVKRREDVDRFHDFLVAEGITVLDPRLPILPMVPAIMQFSLPTQMG